jgi:acyl-coenzyme A thioesterase PaaI-like protein
VTGGVPKIGRAALAGLLRSSPHSAALGLEIAEDEGERVALVIPAREAHRSAAGRDSWHPGAIGSVLDTILSIAALGIVDPESRPATVDLRWDMIADPGFGDLRVEATWADPTAEVVFTQAEVVDIASGALVCWGRACIAYAPPVDGSSGRTVAGEGEDRVASDFSAWLGLVTDAQGISHVPYREGLGGAAGLPYWHGGALTAAMTAAAIDRAAVDLPGARLASATASFNLFAIDQPLLLDSSDYRATRTRASVQIACAQEGRGVTSRMTAHFVRGRRGQERRGRVNWGTIAFHLSCRRRLA